MLLHLFILSFPAYQVFRAAKWICILLSSFLRGQKMSRNISQLLKWQVCLQRPFSWPSWDKHLSGWGRFLQLSRWVPKTQGKGTRLNFRSMQLSICKAKVSHRHAFPFPKSFSKCLIYSDFFLKSFTYTKKIRFLGISWKTGWCGSTKAHIFTQ